MSDLRIKIREFLKEHNSLSLAYTDEHGIGNCALWYVSDQSLCLYYLSKDTTRHGQALRTGGKVAFTIHKDDQSWDRITGIQGKGFVDLVKKSLAWDLYVDKFPFVKQKFRTLQQALDSSVFWRITPSWFRLIDNSVEFGFKEEIELD